MAEAIAIPQPTLGVDTLNKAKEIASNKGQERRERFGNNINKLFNNIKTGLDKAVNVVFGAPEAVSYVGKEALMATDMAVDRVMVSAENTLNRWGERIDNGLNRLQARQDAAVQKAEEKLNKLASTAVTAGLNASASVETRIANAIFGIPIWIKETKASTAQNNKDREEARLTAVEAKKQAIIDKETKLYQEKIAKLNEYHNFQKTNIEASRDAADKKAQELKNQAKSKREESARWGVVRKFIAAL